MIRQSFSIHELSIRLGERVAAKSENQQQENMLIYGAEVLLGGMIKIFLLIALSSFMGIRNETLVIVLAAGAFRLLTGGAHSSAYYRCLISSLIIFLGLGYLLNVSLPFFSNFTAMQLSAVLIPGLFWVLRYAPVPPENKPLKSRRDYWTRKLYAGFIYTGIIGLFYFTNMERWKLAVATGVIWQAFTLTHAGHRVINFGEW